MVHINGAPADQSSVCRRLLALVTTVATSLTACFGGTDPNAATRDRLRAHAEDVAASLELPPGYRRLETRHEAAQTPTENRGGGQSGGVTVSFEAPSGATNKQVLEDFNRHFVDRGYTPAVYLKGSRCDGRSLEFSWANQDHVIHLVHLAPSLGPTSFIDIPYSWDGAPRLGSANVKAPAVLPVCPD